MENMTQVTVSERRWTKLIYIVPFTIIALFNLYLVLKGSTDALGIFLFIVGPLIFFSWYYALYEIQLTEDNVTVNTLFGRFCITWDEVESILIKKHRVALFGKNKRVVLSPDPMWVNVKAMLEFVNEKIYQRNIKVREDSHIPRLHKNSKVQC